MYHATEPDQRRNLAIEAFAFHQRDQLVAGTGQFLRQIPLVAFQNVRIAASDLLVQLV